MVREMEREAERAFFEFKEICLKNLRFSNL